MKENLEMREFISAQLQQLNVDDKSKNLIRDMLSDAYSRGAASAKELLPGQTGTFGQALVSLSKGKSVRRKSWSSEVVFITKQTDACIPMCDVQRLRNLPHDAQKKVIESGYGSLRRRNTMIVVYPSTTGMVASSYVPDWEEIFADDWELLSND